MGAGTGVADVHNLCWKLAAVIAGAAGPALLDTYDIERRPVGRLAAERAGALSGEAGLLSLDRFVATAKGDTLRMSGCGYQYHSPAIIPGSEDPLPFRLDGRPGTRASHAWLERGNQRLSTLDLFGRHFVLLTGPDGTAWRDAADAVSTELGMPLDAYRIGPTGDLAEPDGRWPAVAGIGADGALLVRPDGFVAWRARGPAADPRHVLAGVLSQVLAAPVPRHP